jgi:glycogen synthase
MRVLMTADCVGGVWTYAQELAAALAPHGVEMHLATMGPGPDDGQRRAAAAVVAGLHESGFALEWEDDPWDDVDRAGEWLLGLADDIQSDVVHLNGFAHAALPWRAPVLVAAHSDVISWWRAVRRSPVPARLDTYRKRAQAGLRAADIVCAPTRAVLDDLSANYVFETPRAVIPNGRTFRVTPPGAKQPFVAGLGRFWDEAKNVAALERVAGRTPWPVLIAGPGTSLGRLSQEAAGWLLARASIFASPARYEPFGLAALEAAQASCALVLGDLASLREVWGNAAAYAAPDDDEALLATLQDLCGDDGRRSALAAQGRARAARYTPTAMAAATLALYERLSVEAAA